MFILNNMKATTKINQKSRERERERMLLCAASNYLLVCHSMAKRPDVLESWTALNINEFILFDMFGSPCRRVVMFSKFAGSLNMVF